MSDNAIVAMYCALVIVLQNDSVVFSFKFISIKMMRRTTTTLLQRRTYAKVATGVPIIDVSQLGPGGLADS